MRRSGASAAKRVRIAAVIDPIAFQLGPISVHWYGIIIALAVLAAGWVGTIEARRRGMDPDVGWAMLLPVLVAAVIGARIYHVIHQWDFYVRDPVTDPADLERRPGHPGRGGRRCWRSGSTRAGSVQNTARWLDVFASAMLLGQAIGRLGNFVNQELYGPPTTCRGESRSRGAPHRRVDEHDLFPERPLPPALRLRGDPEPDRLR